MSDRYFLKRIYTLRRYWQDIIALLASPGSIGKLMRGSRVSAAFRERIMIAVTQVNGCRWCSYAHARMALNAGLSQEEISRLFEGVLDEVADDELPALLFAQHFAESGSNPDPEMSDRLVATYGEQKAADILTAIRMITMGNLLGNTFDAFISRFSRGPKPPTSILNEIAVFASVLLSAPFLLLFALFSLVVGAFRSR